MRPFGESAVMTVARMFNARRIVVCVSAAMLAVALSAVTSTLALAAVSQVGSCTIAPLPAGVAVQAEPTGDRAVKEPGGPLGIDLRDHTYWRGGYGLWTGYSMQVQGWLRRKN